MDGDHNWIYLPKDILIVLVHRLICIQDYVSFSAVCKSWKSAAEDYKPLLPPKYPLLLLAEDVVPGSIISDGEFDSDSNYSCDDLEYADEYVEDDEDDDKNSETDVNSNDDDDEDNSETDDDSVNNDDDDICSHKISPYDKHNHQNNSIGTSRGLYSLSTGKTYILELPQASGRLILGANHGWLLTLGRDLQIHLLHPLLRCQIPLPPMPTLPIQYNYVYSGFTPEERSDMFIRKVILSSKVPKKDEFNLHDNGNPTPPIVMVSYGECGYLAFFRFGDKVWTHVDIPTPSIQDIVYHRGRFFTVNGMGNVFVCHIDDRGGPRAIQIASLSHHYFQNRKYLVESISGTLFLLVRICKTKCFFPTARPNKYRTTNFLVWKLDLQYCHDSLQIPSCTLIREKNLGNQAIFVGRGSSVSVSPSETIRPNCIYFTDDRDDCYSRVGGGHDMGIFSMEDHTIEPHFPGKSIHFISPPLWYI